MAERDPRTRAPLVSIVIARPVKSDDLRRGIRRLADTTRYPAFEVIVVSRTNVVTRWLDRRYGVPFRRIAWPEGGSFAEAAACALDNVRGELVLMLDAAAEPRHPDWLDRLAAPLLEDGAVAATGPVLTWPTGASHWMRRAGMRFVLHGGSVRARFDDASHDPDQPTTPGHRRVDALPATCLLSRAAAFRAAGFDESDGNGDLDWGLSVRLGELGHLLCVPRSELRWHGPTRDPGLNGSSAASLSDATANARWGPRLRRQLLIDQLRVVTDPCASQRPSFVVEPRRAESLTLLRQSLRTAGWRDWGGDRDDPPTIEVATAAAGDPPVAAGVTAFVPTDASGDDAPDRTGVIVRLDGRDAVSTTLPTASVDLRGDARPFIDALRDFVDKPRFAIRNCAPDRQRAGRWGDTHFADSLAAALGRRGFEARSHTEDEWELPAANTFDVVIHLRGVHRYRPQPGATNVLWLISHPDEVTDEEIDEFDHVLVSSSVFASHLTRRTSRPVSVMHQAADTYRFHPLGRGMRRGASRIAVVANARWPSRPAARWLMELGWKFSLYGANWEAYPESSHVAETYVPNDELAHIYATADIVVADQWEYMAREGFVANRLFDIAASGGFVISDDGPGVRELFGELVPTYRTRGDLDELVRYYIDRPKERSRISSELMSLVRREHSFDRRVDAMLRLLGVG